MFSKRIIMTRLSWIELSMLFAVITGVRCLGYTRLEVLPEVVERGGEAILRCHYELGDDKLYALKWYRGTKEFYRFSPDRTPTTQSFALAGIDVNPQKSNESQVTIRNVEYSVTGNYSCEVTAESTFATEVGWNKLVVVSRPQVGPIIRSEKERYDPGDTLKANCTVPPSEPPVIISFTLNNKPVGQSSADQQEQKRHKSNYGSNEGSKVGPGSYNVHQQQQQRQQQQQQPHDDLQSSELSLDLQPFHYVNGQLTLRCIVVIPGIYNATAETQLGTGLREPVPERVTSENAATDSYVFSRTLLSLVIVHGLVR